MLKTQMLMKNRFKGVTNQITEVLDRRRAKQDYEMSESVEDACKHRKHERLNMLKDTNDE